MYLLLVVEILVMIVLVQLFVLGCKAVIQLEMMPEPPHERLDSNPWPEWPRVKKDRLWTK